MGVYFYSILEVLQYGALYLFAAFGAGVALDTLFPHYDDKKSTRELLVEVLLQSLALIVVAFFIRVFVKRVPILFPVRKGSGYVPYDTTEYGGELMTGLIFLGCQINLVKKIDALSSRLYKWMYNVEKNKIGSL